MTELELCEKQMAIAALSFNTMAKTPQHNMPLSDVFYAIYGDYPRPSPKQDTDYNLLREIRRWRMTWGRCCVAKLREPNQADWDAWVIYQMSSLTTAQQREVLDYLYPKHLRVNNLCRFAEDGYKHAYVGNPDNPHHSTHAATVDAVRNKFI